METTGVIAQPGSGKSFVYETMNNGFKRAAIDFLPAVFHKYCAV